MASETHGHKKPQTIDNKNEGPRRVWTPCLWRLVSAKWVWCWVCGVGCVVLGVQLCARHGNLYSDCSTGKEGIHSPELFGAQSTWGPYRWTPDTRISPNREALDPLDYVWYIPRCSLRNLDRPDPYHQRVLLQHRACSPPALGTPCLSSSHKVVQDGLSPLPAFGHRVAAEVLWCYLITCSTIQT
jgi:hypothetical protein